MCRVTSQPIKLQAAITVMFELQVLYKLVTPFCSSYIGLLLLLHSLPEDAIGLSLDEPNDVLRRAKSSCIRLSHLHSTTTR